ncbi:hypothetical protein SAMN04515674_10298 [Pseudarcicella hirudinis]|uniref:Uncharacterized protein n=1 Tax=Pseudarcicella hirudinis TaxID=1079859 RepID=A0A1I5NSD8_9BACT|nr:hypothetical protein [Pseudarcicella hirudinis]SFP24758.1 hypothetical protein SAMN04515674_10298 [Pseudarcicella hirudinis]
MKRISVFKLFVAFFLFLKAVKSLKRLLKFDYDFSSYTAGLHSFDVISYNAVYIFIFCLFVYLINRKDSLPARNF